MVSDDSNYAKWRVPVIEHSSIERFETRHTIGDGVHRIWLGESHLDILVKQRKLGNVLVVFGGAVSREEGKPPFFSGVGLTDKMPFSLVAVSDPAFTVDGEISIGWYTGIRGEPATQAIARAIDAILEKWGKSKAISLGGSAGGFASLSIAPLLRGKNDVVVMNPQTDIYKYHYRLAVDRWKSLCKDEESNTPTNLVSLFAGLRQKPRVIFFQNRSDIHRESHAKPFYKVMGNYGTVVEGDWGLGHVPPPTSLLAAYLIPLLLPDPVAVLVEKISPRWRQLAIEKVSSWLD